MNFPGPQPALPPTAAPAVRLRRYLGAVLALLVSAEALARAFEPWLAAAADRVAFKAALFERQGPTARVFIGTSRLNDGVRARDLHGFNASVPSSSLAVQTWLFERGLTHAGLREVVLELSPEQVTDDARVAAGAAREPLALLTHRRAFALENLPRLWALALASRYDGSEWFRNRWALEGLRELRGVEVPTLDAASAPARVAEGPDVAEWESVVGAYVALSDRARAAGVALLFVLPPSAPEARAGQCSGTFAALAPMVARRTGRRVLDYSCSALPEALFTDRTHLGARGRAWLTRSLGQELDAL